MGKACHIKSEMPITYANGTLMQAVRKMNLKLRWGVGFGNRHIYERHESQMVVRSWDWIRSAEV